MHKEYPDTVHAIKTHGQMTDQVNAKMKEACEKFAQTFTA